MHSTASFAVLAAFVIVVAAIPAPSGDAVTSEADPSYIVSHKAMLHWIATTDAELTFIGEPINPLSPDAAQNTIVTYCTHRSQSICGGPCTVYNGGAACLQAPDTNCLSATRNVAFCDGKSCNHSCNPLATCGVHLDNGFCFTPGTNSIIVSTA